ncbi:LLM class flavin-dependent oxidoreductase [Pseudonocardia acaciae]|uniref:LLM class flavin-dependent oxidoreductase n=1 Tax=Pseudonocardia acaciae TaxID=551276 RepID=UPI00048BCA4D|nr:LLM class flavin-dependent oxidoreductase [Pseudonocardia acaciae]
MRCGIFLLAGRFPGQDDATALRRAVDAVVCAERSGFDDAWIAEHHFMPYGTCPSAVTFAAHALGRTTGLVVGTAVSVLSTAHPVALAEQALLLDQVSDGRFRLGVGRGGPWVDLEVFGTGLDRYDNGFGEGLDLVLAAMAGGRVDARGDRFRFRPVPIVPEPLTRPRPPVAVACTSTATVEIAALRGLPMLLGMHIDDEDKAAMVAHHSEVARAAGHDPSMIEHVSAVVAHVAEDRERAVRELRAAMPGWLAAGLAAHVPVDGRPAPSRDPHRYTEELCARHPVGSPEDCIARLRAAAAHTGIRHVIMMVEGAGTREHTLTTIERLAAEVLPHLAP